MELQAYAQSKGFSGELALWDVPYWSERLREVKKNMSAPHASNVPFPPC